MSPKSSIIAAVMPLCRKFTLYLLALALPACLWLAASAEEIRFEPVKCPQNHVAAQCGFVHLPENRDDSSGKVQVFIVQLGTENNTTPAVVLGGGGPGGHLYLDEEGGIDYWEIYRKENLGAQGRLILMDQRGTGLSKPKLNCPEEKPLVVESLGQPLSSAEETARYIPVLQECLSRLRADGIQVTAHTTIAAADDVEDIRRLLGIDQWHLIGFSYGTRLALEVMRRHPDGVASALLDSAFPYDSWRQRPSYPFAATMEKIAADCAQQAHCRRHGDVLANIEKAMQLAAREPLILRTQYGGTTHDIALTPDRLLFLLHFGVYGETGVAILPLLTHQLAQGKTDTEHAAYFAFDYLDLLLGDSLASMLYYTISCQENPFSTVAPTTPLQQYEYNSAQQVSIICDSLWGAPPSQPPIVTSEIPVLLINGAYDPATPPQWAQNLAERLPNAQHLVGPASHSESGQIPCLQEAVRTFFGSPSATISHLCDNETLTFH